MSKLNLLLARIVRVSRARYNEFAEAAFRSEIGGAVWSILQRIKLLGM